MLDIANQWSDIIPHTSYVRHKTKYIRLQTAGIRTQMSPLIKHVFQLTSKARGWELMNRKWRSGRHSRNHGQRVWRPTGWKFSTEKFLALLLTCTCNLLMLLPISNQLWLCFTFGRPRADRGYANATTLPRRRRNTATIGVVLIGSVPPCILGIIRPFVLFLTFCQQLPHWRAPHGLVGQVAKKSCGWIFLRTIVDWVRYAAECHLWEICNYERFPISWRHAH